MSESERSPLDEPRALRPPCHVKRPASASIRAAELSVVAPAYDEEENLRPLYERVRDALGTGLAWELVLVDDGSTDGTPAVLRALAAEDPRVVPVRLAANRGQSAAIAVGIAVASGERIATLDADLQNDPHDLPAMLEALGAHDAVVGYRLRRRDTWVRRASSRVANAVRNRLTGDSVRDTGCGLKLFRAEAVRSLPWFDGMHRFLPTLLRIHGFSVVEHPVAHHPRVAGRSKYGIANRAFRAFVDLLAVRWMKRRVLRVAVDEAFARSLSCSNDSSPPPAGSGSRPSRPASSSSGSPRNARAGR